MTWKVTYPTVYKSRILRDATNRKFTIMGIPTSNGGNGSSDVNVRTDAIVPCSIRKDDQTSGVGKVLLWHVDWFALEAIIVDICKS